MAQHGVNHDYHIINPSPWPLLASVFSVVLFLGAVIWMKGLFGIDGPWIFLAGLLGIFYVMYMWWRDVIRESKAGDHTPVVQLGLRYGSIMFIASEVMFFVAWFWIFFEGALFWEHRSGAASAIEEVRLAWSTWPPAGIETVSAWQLPLVNTLLLLLSGTTVTWAHHALQENDRKGAKLALAITLVLAVAFTIVQVIEYQHIFHHHYFFNEAATHSGLYPSAFLLATGFHGFHVVVGTIFLAVCLIRLFNGDFTPQKHFGFESAAWYWHFVDVVWLFLFAFIYVVFA
ncbi:MAG: cytochrome c oxidase subunit 3 [Asticcacaulis sp.]